MKDYSLLSYDNCLSRLHLPTEPVQAVLDTDTYNEIDDQFALTYALLNRHKLKLSAIYAAPFLNSRSTSPAEGMERSYDEILKVMRLISAESDVAVYHGARGFMGTDAAPVDSAAVRDLLTRSAQLSEAPLYVIAIGAPTNIASALTTDPSLVTRIVVVWLGGHPIDHSDTDEFNLRQDLAASRILFDSGVPLILVPCRQVAELLCTTTAELTKHLRGISPIAKYLCEIACEYIDGRPGSSRPLWDLAAVSLLMHPEWFSTQIISSPRIGDNLRWEPTKDRHPIRVVTYINRDEVMRSLFESLHRGKPSGPATQ